MKVKKVKAEPGEILKHANWIEYLANKNISVGEKKDKKGEKFLYLSKQLDEKMRKRIINHLLHEYDDVESINRAIEDYKFENKKVNGKLKR